MAKKKYIPTPKELEERLLDRYKRWKSIYEEGCTDPFYEDGTNLCLVRNHISYYKKECEQYLGDNFHLYPDAYFFPIPIEVPHNFMAVDRETGIPKRLIPANKTLPYEEAVKFDWSEVLCPSQ